jgi:hypothetical protein
MVVKLQTDHKNKLQNSENTATKKAATFSDSRF